MSYKILLASDGSDNALRAAEHVLELMALTPEIEVTVLVVNEVLEKMKQYSPFRPPIVIAEVEEFFKEKSQEALDKTIAVFKNRQIPAEGVIKYGHPAKEIVEYAEEGGYNQIVIGSRGMGSLKGIIMGSVSSKVIHLASVPVTVVK